MGGNYLPLVDDDVIRKAQNADTEAFSQIYKAYYNKVYFIAYQYYRDDENAKDIVQEVFIRVHNKIKYLKEPRTFSKWLSRITYSVCVNHNRRKLKTIDLGESLTVENFSKTSHLSPSDDLENKRVNEIITNSLEAMSTPLKTVGMMRYYEGLQINEIAQILKVPKGTVNSRLNRIRKLLQKELTKNGISPKNYGVVLAPSIIIAAYQKLSTQYTMAQVSSTSVLKTVMGTGAATSRLVLPFKFAMGGVISTAVITGVVLLNQPEKSIEAKNPHTTEAIVEVESQVIDEKAFISNIDYNSNWTNEVITLIITTTNENYDQILVNGSETREIIENGNYHIELLKNGVVLDQRDIEILTIDTHSPNATYEQDGNKFTYYLSDNLSQMDVTSIRFYKDGAPSMNYDFNVETGILIIESEDATKDSFYISDYAGNELEILIQ